jgi:hypothetical protein
MTILQSNMVLSVSPFHVSKILSSDASLIVLASSLKVKFILTGSFLKSFVHITEYIRRKNTQYCTDIRS